MLDAARESRFRALWIIGWDVLRTNPGVAATREALAALDVLVVQDLFLNETARDLATVFLPAAAAFEKDGTFMNAERRVQRVRRAVPPPAGVPADWEIVGEVARAMGHADGFGFASAAEIWDEIRTVWPAGAGISYSRLEHGGIQWPCPTESHPGTSVLHSRGFARGDRAALTPVAPEPSPEEPTAPYPLLLTTGRTLHQFNAGTMTRRTPQAALHGDDVLTISPEDARRHGVEHGELVRVRSRHGEASLAASVDADVPAGVLFATFHGEVPFINAVIGPHRDERTGTPAYKVTAVAIERVARRAG
jgi:formate dehydrogenase major subunit